MKITQKKIAKQIGVPEGYLSELINRKKIPLWENAKRLAEKTGTTPVLWCDGTKEEIKKALGLT